MDVVGVGCYPKGVHGLSWTGRVLWKQREAGFQEGVWQLKRDPGKGPALAAKAGRLVWVYPRRLSDPPLTVLGAGGQQGGFG